MCDTLTALGPATFDGRTLFAKNSDRERNEAQGVSFSPARASPPGASQSPTRLAPTLASRPRRAPRAHPPLQPAPRSCRTAR